VRVKVRKPLHQRDRRGHLSTILARKHPRRHHVRGIKDPLLGPCNHRVPRRGRVGILVKRRSRPRRSHNQPPKVRTLLPQHRKQVLPKVWRHLKVAGHLRGTLRKEPVKEVNGRLVGGRVRVPQVPLQRHVHRLSPKRHVAKVAQKILLAPQPKRRPLRHHVAQHHRFVRLLVLADKVLNREPAPSLHIVRHQPPRVDLP